MSSQPNELPQEDLRNCLQLLRTTGRERPDASGDALCFEPQEYDAIVARLEAALAKLEAPGPLRAETYGNWPYPADGITLRAAGDRIVRIERNYIVREDSADEERRRAASQQPLDYERPGQVDPVLRGQEISEDGE